MHIHWTRFPLFFVGVASSLVLIHSRTSACLHLIPFHRGVLRHNFYHGVLEHLALYFLMLNDLIVSEWWSKSCFCRPTTKGNENKSKETSRKSLVKKRNYTHTLYNMAKNIFIINVYVFAHVVLFFFCYLFRKYMLFYFRVSSITWKKHPKNACQYDFGRLRRR